MDMTKENIVRVLLENVPENQLIFVNQYYQENFSTELSESTYYRVIAKLTTEKFLCRIAKGIYYRPKISKYGLVPPSQSSIIDIFTKNNSGMVVGYPLYNRLNLTTQISKNIEVYSSILSQKSMTIQNITVLYYDLTFTDEVIKTVQILDVLEHFNKIQDLNYHAFISYCKSFSTSYSDEIFYAVDKVFSYTKNTKSFLKSVLDYYGVPNTLNESLASLSNYTHPKTEDIYKAVTCEHSD